MDQRPRRSVFERLGRLPREYSSLGPGSSGNSQALLPVPTPLLRYPERPAHELSIFQRNRRRLNTYEDHYGSQIKKGRLDVGLEKAPLLQLRQMPIVVQPKEKKIRIRRRKQRPIDETLDEGEIVDDDDDEEYEYEEYSEDEEDNIHDDKSKNKFKLSSQILDKRQLPLSGKETDTLSLKSFDSSSEKLSQKVQINSSQYVKSSNELHSDKGSNYSDWSDDDILLRDETQKDEHGEENRSRMDNTKDGIQDSFATDNNTHSDNDHYTNQSTGSQHKIEALEAISDDDFDAYDQDLLERNKDCMEEVLMSEMLTTVDVSITDILSIDWKSLLSPMKNSKDNEDYPIPLKSSIECRTNKSKCCLEMLNRIGHSKKLAGDEISNRIAQSLREKLPDDFVEQNDLLAFLHNNRYRKSLLKKQHIFNNNSQHPVIETATHFQDDFSTDSQVM